MSTTRTLVGLMAMFLGTVVSGCRDGEADRPVALPEPFVPAVVTPTAAPDAPARAPDASAPTAPAKPGSTTEPRRVQTAAEGSLVVKRLVVAHGVKNREPVEPGATFKGATHKVYAFVEIENQGQAAGEIRVEFEPPSGGAPHGDVTLAVGAAPRWRTWAFTRTASTPGTWTAVVKSRKGEVLARTTFEVEL